MKKIIRTYLKKQLQTLSSAYNKADSYELHLTHIQIPICKKQYIMIPKSEYETLENHYDEMITKTLDCINDTNQVLELLMSNQKAFDFDEIIRDIRSAQQATNDKQTAEFNNESTPILERLYDQYYQEKRNTEPQR